VLERGVSQFWPRAIALADEQASLPVRKTEENWGPESEEQEDKARALQLYWFPFSFSNLGKRDVRVGVEQSKMGLEIGKAV